MKKGNKATTETNSKPTKPLTVKELEKQLRSGNLTRQQAIELRQKYMDSLEYNEEQQFAAQEHSLLQERLLTSFSTKCLTNAF